jgi:1,4-alpha-glucan branching enzyme
VTSSAVWHLFLSDTLYGDRIAHATRVKVHVVGGDGSRRDRIPAYARRVIADPQTNDYSAQIWLPESAGQGYTFLNNAPNPPTGEGLRIYEAHVGNGAGSGKGRLLRRVSGDRSSSDRASGYNAVQLMAIQEHPYYASFGYHVSSFFAVSSRFGTRNN